MQSCVHTLVQNLLPSDQTVNGDAPKVKPCNKRLFSSQEFNELREVVGGSGGEIETSSERISLPDFLTNPSVVEYRGKVLVAVRDEKFPVGIEIYDISNGVPLFVSGLKLDHSFYTHGVIDPRFFHHNDKLYIAASGGYPEGGYLKVRMVVAELDLDFNVSHCWSPDLPIQATWEKNWGFFSWEDKLFSVYSISPHRVLRHDGCKASLAYLSGGTLGWRGGFLRGGASPVRLGDQFYSFFHGMLEHPSSVRMYTMGCYTFSAKPPFQPLRITRQPLLSPSSFENHLSVVFPGGALFRGDHWLISFGYQDRESRIFKLGVAELESKLSRI